MATHTRMLSANNCGPFICENVQWPHVERHQQKAVAISCATLCSGHTQNAISKRLWQYHVQHCAVATHRTPSAKGCGNIMCNIVQWPHTERHQQKAVAISCATLCSGHTQNAISKRLWQYHVQHCAVATHRTHQQKAVAISCATLCSGHTQNTISKKPRGRFAWCWAFCQYSMLGLLSVQHAGASVSTACWGFCQYSSAPLPTAKKALTRRQHSKALHSFSSFLFS